MLRVALAALVFLSVQICADETRPGYLEIIESDSQRISVIWKQPSNPGAELQLQLPAQCKSVLPPRIQAVDGASVYRLNMECSSVIAGSKISINGLAASNTDVLLRVQSVGGNWHTSRLGPAISSYVIPVEQNSFGIVGTYTVLGIEHILLGFDHLLFVLALLLIIGNFRQLVVTITAFTLAHTITLAAASLHLVTLPGPPVEAGIALSIVFLAQEILHKKQGRDGLASRFPWIVAFTFGLLHGFGFAGALAEIGLPQQSIPLALVFFNVGVELGQLLFVFAMVAVMTLLRWLKQQKLLEILEFIAAYAVGGLAFYWCINRVASF